MVRIRLRRVGKRKQPVYRVVVADQRSPRDGRFIEIIGQYNPLSHPSDISFDEEKALDWLRKGARPSGSVVALLKRVGIWTKFVADKGPAPKRPKKHKASTAPPKAEAPKAEAPKAEAPKAEAPKAEAPKAEAPATEATAEPEPTESSAGS